MSDVRRFFVEPGSLTGDFAHLEGPEAHHALHVLRVKPGEPLTLFDGQGSEADGRVEAVTRHEVRVQIEARREALPSAYTVTLLQASLHRDKAVEDLIRRGSEIGIRRFVFFGAERSERRPKPSDKWVRWAIDACKQCGRLWLPEFVCTATLTEALDHGSGAHCLLSLHHAEPIPLRRAMGEGDVTVIVGPEGDFTRAEEDACIAAGALPVSLGATVYRAEIAAVLAAALVHYERGSLGALPA